MASVLFAAAPASAIGTHLPADDCAAYEALALRNGRGVFDSQLLIPDRRKPRGNAGSRYDPETAKARPWVAEPAFYGAALDAARIGGKLDCAWSLDVTVRDRPREGFNAVSRVYWDESGARGLFFIYSAMALRIPGETMTGRTSRPSARPTTLQVGAWAVCAVERRRGQVILGECYSYR